MHLIDLIMARKTIGIVAAGVVVGASTTFLVVVLVLYRAYSLWRLSALA